MSMTNDVTAVIEPFVQRGLFENREKAVAEMARVYILRQIQQYQEAMDRLQAQYGMSYEQFNAYLWARAESLVETPDTAVNQAIMREEEDTLDWKIAREMTSNWLGLQIADSGSRPLKH